MSDFGLRRLEPDCPETTDKSGERSHLEACKLDARFVVALLYQLTPRANFERSTHTGIT